MYTLIITTLVMVAALIIYLVLDEEPKEIIWIPLVFGIILGPLFTVMIVTHIINPEIETVKNYTRIASLNDNMVTSGSFILGSGSIENTSYFYFYYKNKYDSWSLGKKKAHDCSIKMRDDSTAYLVEIFQRSNNPWTAIDPNKRYEFLVPENTVVNQFKLNSE